MPAFYVLEKKNIALTIKKLRKRRFRGDDDLRQEGGKKYVDFLYMTDGRNINPIFRLNDAHRL